MKPEAVYLETSVLCSLPDDVGTAELSRLRELCGILNIPIVIPRVALDEWVVKKKERIIAEIRGIKEAMGAFDKLIRRYSPETELFSVNWHEIEETIPTKHREKALSRIIEMEIAIAETPNIPLNLLLEMSINKIRPFEEKGEKGFRDSVILFTVLEFARKFPE